MSIIVQYTQQTKEVNSNRYIHPNSIIISKKGTLVIDLPVHQDYRL